MTDFHWVFEHYLLVISAIPKVQLFRYSYADWIQFESPQYLHHDLSFDRIMSFCLSSGICLLEMRDRLCLEFFIWGIVLCEYIVIFTFYFSLTFRDRCTCIFFSHVNFSGFEIYILMWYDVLFVDTRGI